LTAAQTQQFTATVTGTANTVVSWSLNPSVGTISQAGLYTAPASVSAAQNVTVTATSAADSSKSAQAVVGLSSASTPLENGGLVSFPTPLISANLVSNPGFEQGNAGWSLASGFTVDTTVAHSGQASLRLTNANLGPYTPSATQIVQLKQGIYNFGGWVKVSAIGATVAGSGVRFCLYAPPSYPWTIAASCTSQVSGTADWQYIQTTSITVPQDTSAEFLVDAYGKPDGTAWFDDLTLTRSQLPLQTFMLYPNYRGILFDDQSQVAQFNIAMDPLGALLPSNFLLSGQVTDEATSTVVLRSSFQPAASLVASFDMSSLPDGHSYQVTFQMNTPDGSQSYTYPAYRIVKMSGSQRASLPVSFDQQNRFLLHGQPTFLLGVYDSGMGYDSDEAAWTSQFTTQRRLFELPINFYLNYWYGAAPNNSILPMMDALQQHGIYNLTNANCSGTSTVDQMGANWFLTGPNSVIQQRGAHPGFGGFYAADECIPSSVSNVFGHYQLMKTLDPGGMVLGTLLPDANLPEWRDAVDVLATDPYPLFGAQPAGGYPLSMVANAALSTQNAVMGSRPFVTVIQFFQFTSNSRWPTQAELRSMSYAAIVGGANGLFYWSLGADALAYICDGSDANHSPAGSDSWCQAKIDNFTNLQNVITEIQALTPALTMPDRPGLLAANSNSTILTRVKYNGTTAYLIAYNASNSAQSVTFQWGQGFTTISVPQEARTIQPNGRSFTDTFVSNGVHVYVIQ
jgi:hypothetical protein